MTRLLHLVSACLAGFALTQAQSTSAGEFPIHGSGSGTLSTAAVVPPAVMSSAMSMSSKMTTSMMATMPTSKTLAALMTMPTMVNNVLTVIVTIDITIIEISMGGTTTTTTMAMAPLATGATHQVTVGGAANVYTPNSVVAAIGDIIVFTFMANNHTLTQSTFDAPCVKVAGAVDSGFMPNINNAVSPPPTFKIQVTSLNEIFFFCAQGDHCIEGMVFTINPSANMSEAAFISKAMMLSSTMTSTTKATTTAMVSTMTTHPTTSMMTTMTTVHPTTMMTTMSTMPLATPSLVHGTGTIINGMCDCACLCGVNAFPTGAGMGAFGGLSGMAPQSAIASVAAMGATT